MRPGEIHDKEADKKAERLTTIAFTSQSKGEIEEDIERNQSPIISSVEKDGS